MATTVNESFALIEHLASMDLRRLSNDGLITELEFARRELLDPTTQGEYRQYQAKRVQALTTEQKRRLNMGERGNQPHITPEFIRDLKDRVDLRDLFNHIGILVIPTGGNREQYQCPAHPDWNPSGVIYVKERQYHCFQCQAHGDCYDALMAFKGMTFIEAVDAVAGYLGMELPKPKAKQAGKGGISL